ncbi:MAG: hypothetical protein LUC48_01275 [Clostridiales bacterium]|nr:hypothetical protein [Clostridiales bacterium]
MGLFSKKPNAPGDAFWDAYQKAAKKEKPEFFAALEEALQNYPQGWQGYFLLGLYYDCGCRLPFDPQKAEDCYKRARAGASGDAEGRKWLDNFFQWYDKPAFMLKTKLSEQTLRMRKIGFAAFNTFEHHQKLLTARIKNEYDSEIFFRLFNSCLSNATKVEGWSYGEYACNAEVLGEFFLDVNLAEIPDDLDMDNVNKGLEHMLKREKKESKRFGKALDDAYDALAAGHPKDDDNYVPPEVTGFPAYFLAMDNYGTGIYARLGKIEQNLKVCAGRLSYAATLGSAFAIDEYARLALESPTNWNAMNQEADGKLKEKLTKSLKECAEAGDELAKAYCVKVMMR